jgi:hypothetical protein
VIFTARLLADARGLESGICKSGIGVVTNSRRTARPSHRAQRFDHAARALSNGISDC